MRESVTYQAILEEGREEGVSIGLRQGREVGRAEGERRMLLLFGASKFGPSDEGIRATIEQIDDVGTLERLAQRLLTVSSWQDLLADHE